MEALKQGSDVLFILLGAILVLAMHSGFAFLELGTVRKKNQVNALVKILVDFSVSTVAYFLVGYFQGSPQIRVKATAQAANNSNICVIGLHGSDTATVSLNTNAGVLVPHAICPM